MGKNGEALFFFREVDGGRAVQVSTEPKTLDDSSTCFVIQFLIPSTKEDKKRVRRRASTYKGKDGRVVTEIHLTPEVTEALRDLLNHVVAQ